MDVNKCVICFLRFTISLLAAAVLLDPPNCPGQLSDPATPRLAIPDLDLQKSTAAIIRDAYAKDMADASTQEMKTALAAKIILASEDPKNDPASRYGLLVTAKSYAKQNLDVVNALDATQKIADTFNVDSAAIELETLTSLSAGVKKVKDARSLQYSIDGEIDRARNDGNYTTERRLADLALTAAHSSGNSVFIEESTRKYGFLVGQSEDFLNYQKGLADLVRNPSNADANLAVGTFLAIHNDWKRAVPKLARSLDLPIRKAAADEILGNPDPTVQLSVSDEWMAAATKDKMLKRAMELHAANGFLSVEEGLTALQKRYVSKRLDAVESAYPFRAQADEISWQKSLPAISLMPVSQGFCVLSSVSGDYQGYGERASIIAGPDNRWTTDCDSHQDRLTSRFISYKKIGDCFYQSQITFYKWFRGDGRVKMINKSEGFCFLVGISGHFEGERERVQISLDPDGFWYLNGRSEQDSLCATAISIRFANPKLVANDLRLVNWKFGDRPLRLLRDGEGICGLSGVEGRLGTEGAQAGLRLNGDGIWYLDGQSQGRRSFWVQATVFKYPTN